MDSTAEHDLGDTGNARYPCSGQDFWSQFHSVTYLAGQPVPVLLCCLDLGETNVGQRDLSKGCSEIDRSREPEGASQKQLGLGRRLR